MCNGIVKFIAKSTLYEILAETENTVSYIFKMKFPNKINPSQMHFVILKYEYSISRTFTAKHTK